MTPGTPESKSVRDTETAGRNRKMSVDSSRARSSVPHLIILAFPVLLAMNGLVSQVLADRGHAGLAFGALKDLALVVLLAWCVWQRRLKQLDGMLVALVVAYVLCGAVSAVWSNDALAAMYGWRNDYEPALLLLAATPFFADENLRSRWIVAVAATMNVASVALVVTWAVGLDWLVRLGILPVAPGEPFPSSYFSAGEAVPRGFSPWVAPNQAGVALVMMLACVLAGATWRWWIRLAVCVIPVVGVFLTSSRSAWLGLVAVGFGIIVIQVLKRWGVRFALIAAAAALAAAGAGSWWYFGASGRMASDPSLGGHSSSLNEALSLITARPWGHGLGDVGPRSSLYGGEGILIESFWLLIATEAGVLALLLFLAVQVVVAVRLLVARSWPAWAGLLVIAGSVVSQVVLPTFQEGAVVYFFWLSLAWALGWLLNPRNDSDRLGRPLGRPKHRLDHEPTTSSV